MCQGCGTWFGYDIQFIRGDEGKIVVKDGGASSLKESRKKYNLSFIFCDMTSSINGNGITRKSFVIGIIIETS